LKSLHGQRVGSSQTRLLEARFVLSQKAPWSWEKRKTQILRLLQRGIPLRTTSRLQPLTQQGLSGPCVEPTGFQAN